MRYLSKTSRREFLVRTGAVALGAAACRGGKMSAPQTMNASELIELTATAAVRALRQGDIKAEDYASALLARCEAAKSLNAFITLEPTRVLEAARAADRLRESGAPLSPLHGLPIPIKDSVNTRDFPTTGGTKALRSFRPREDAPLVRKLVDAGGIVMGKTNIHELSFGWTSNNLEFGAVKNPYDPTRIPGGSSGGTAAAVAARMAPLGVAEDTEGSIRVPAAIVRDLRLSSDDGTLSDDGSRADLAALRSDRTSRSDRGRSRTLRPGRKRRPVAARASRDPGSAHRNRSQVFL